MRWVISATAFCVPLLLIISIGGTCAGSGGPAPQLEAALIGELRSFTVEREGLLDRYALRPGQAESPAIPHLALERFDRRGVDAQGRPWYRLARTPPGVQAGLLRNDAAASPARVVGGAAPTLVVPLGPRWAYWELRSAGPRNSP